MTALQSIFDLLHTFGLDAFKIPAAGPSVSSDDPQASADDQGAGDDHGQVEDRDRVDGQQDKSAASSVLAILTGLLDSEVSV